jgi:hypothetical protein
MKSQFRKDCRCFSISQLSIRILISYVLTPCVLVNTEVPKFLSLCRQNTPQVLYSPTRISGGGSVSRGGIMQQATEKGLILSYMKC